MIALSIERASRMHMQDLRREAYARARARQAGTRAGERIAAALRAWAKRFDPTSRSAEGPWREDFEIRAAERA